MLYIVPVRECKQGIEHFLSLDGIIILKTVVATDCFLQEKRCTKE